MSVQRRRALVAGAAVTAVAVIVVAVLITGGDSSSTAASAAPSGPGSETPTPTPSASPSVPISPVAESTSPAPPTPSSVVTLTAVGDVALGNTPDLPPDPAGYFAQVRSALAAPIVFGNLEGALTDASTSKCAPPTPKSTPTTPSPTPSPPPTPTPTPSPSPSRSPSPSPQTCFAFRMPTSFAAAFRAAGFTVLNSANNHSRDFGARGLADTTAALKAAGITQTGLRGQIGVVDANGVRVAFVGFAPYSYTSNLLDDASARHLIASAQQQADLVVVYMHAGVEGSAATHVSGRDEKYLGEDRGNPQAFAHAAIDAGADLVLASGPHVLRGMEYYRGHLIAYSLGDFAGYYNFSTTGALALSGILRVSLAAGGRPTTARFTSIVLDAKGRPAIDPQGGAAQLVNELSTADFGASAATISDSGEITPAAARAKGS